MSKLRPNATPASSKTAHPTLSTPATPAPLVPESSGSVLVDDLNADDSLGDVIAAMEATGPVGVTNGEGSGGTGSEGTVVSSDAGSGVDAVAVVEAPPASLATDKPPYAPSLISDAAATAAREAVERVLADQARERLFDVIEDRVTLTLQPDDLAVLREQWDERNSDRDGSDKIPFSTFLSLRLRACRTHVGARPVFVTDAARQILEDLFGDIIYSDTDLLNKVDRHIRPIIESADADEGVMRLDPLDPRIIELVPLWYPDKSPVKAISDFIRDAVAEKAGLV